MVVDPKLVPLAVTFLDGNTAPTNTCLPSPSEEETAKAKNSLVPLVSDHPPPANTLHTVTDPAFLRYSLTVCGTKVSELRGPNFLSYSEKLLTTVGTNAGPYTVGPIIAAPIAPTP